MKIDEPIIDVSNLLKEFNLNLIIKREQVTAIITCKRFILKDDLSISVLKSGISEWGIS